jgi:hypothetical protein
MSRTNGSVYSGLVSNNCCVFVTNDIFGAGQDDCAIVELNRHCGAFVVTAGNMQLKRFIELWRGSDIPRMAASERGLSAHLAETLAGSFETEFKRNPDFVANPLPFLLLMIGHNPQDSSLEHIFMRNRVLEASVKEGRKEYKTGFEIQPPIPARSLFYGHAELSRYWARPLKDDRLDMPSMKILACYSLLEIQRLDSSLNPAIRMAALSEDEGFCWISGDELQRTSALAGSFDISIRKGLADCFAAVAKKEF